MFKKWWLVKSIDGEWLPTRVTTFFGVPFFIESSFMVGPFETLTECTNKLCEIVVEEYHTPPPT
jgi:hypothetical protein